MPVKTEAQQVVLALHRLRAQLMKMRIMQTNVIRGLMYEFGIVMSEGHRALLKELPGALQEAKSKLPTMFIECMDEQVRRINDLERDIATIERRLSEHLRESAACKTLAEIPGVGLMTATAVCSPASCFVTRRSHLQSGRRPYKRVPRIGVLLRDAVVTAGPLAACLKPPPS